MSSKTSRIKKKLDRQLLVFAYQHRVYEPVVKDAFEVKIKQMVTASPGLSRIFENSPSRFRAIEKIRNRFEIQRVYLNVVLCIRMLKVNKAFYNMRVATWNV